MKVAPEWWKVLTSVINIKMQRRRASHIWRPLSLPQVFWCSCPSWFSTSLFWHSWPVTTPFLSTTSSPGQCRVLAVRAPSLSWVGSSSCCWRYPAAPGRNASLIRTVVVSGLAVMCREVRMFPRHVLAKRLYSLLTWKFIFFAISSFHFSSLPRKPVWMLLLNVFIMITNHVKMEICLLFST